MGVSDREGFEFFPTTADLGVFVYSASLVGLFEQAGKALFSVMTDITTVEASSTYDVVIQAPSLEELLVGWLNELLYLYEIHHAFFTVFDLHITPDNKLSGRVSGERIDARRHPLEGEVKAVTYHQLKIEFHGKLYHARIILDV